jgi:hypothetical protein
MKQRLVHGVDLCTTPNSPPVEFNLYDSILMFYDCMSTGKTFL